jgi:hypothetical protein
MSGQDDFYQCEQCGHTTTPLVGSTVVGKRLCFTCANKAVKAGTMNIPSKTDLAGRIEKYLSDHEVAAITSPSMELLREALTALRPVETTGWQPIETAPKSRSDAGKDRETVLVVYPGWKDGKPDPFVITAFQDSLGWDTGVWRLHEEPTHWMPLPKPPGSSLEPTAPLNAAEMGTVVRMAAIAAQVQSEKASEAQCPFTYRGTRCELEVGHEPPHGSYGSTWYGSDGLETK